MGINILVANLDKKQYLAFWKLGENPSIKAYLEGDHAWAIAILTCEAQGLRIGPPAGSWSGDRVVAVMDCAPPNEFGTLTQTAEEPERNLYMTAWQEYQDYSYDAMAALCEHTNWYARVLAERVKYDEEHKADDRSRTERLWHYGNIVFRLNCKELEYALDREPGVVGFNDTTMLRSYTPRLKTTIRLCSAVLTADSRSDALKKGHSTIWLIVE